MKLMPAVSSSLVMTRPLGRVATSTSIVARVWPGGGDTAVQVSPSNGPTEWQEAYEIQAMHSRRIAAAAEAAE